MSIESERIRELRRERGLSQRQIADELGVSLPTYIKIEAGKRPLTINDIRTISSIFAVPVDDILTPPENIEKFKQMYFYILEKMDKKKGVPKTKLAKLLYLADFAYYRTNKRPISGVKYKNKQYGPLADRFLELTDDLYDSGKIRIDVLDGGAFMIVNTSRDVKFNMLEDTETKLIDRICEQWKDKNTNEIVNFTHEQKPWKSTKEGEYIPYSLILDEEEEHVYTPIGY